MGSIIQQKALIMYGGWDGHEPQRIAERFKTFLESAQFAVSLSETVYVLEDTERLLDLDLFIPIWSICTEQLPDSFFEPLLAAVGSGLGMAGCHGGMCGAFSSNAAWNFLTGGNFIAHPGDDGVRYRINITSKAHQITEGIADFDVVSEQYYMHVDPANEVLATTRFPSVHWYHAANGDVDMPQVWTRKWGKGRVFYNALGHHNDIFDIPQAWELMKRGMVWASRNGRQ